jgi:hypothetical protein
MKTRFHAGVAFAFCASVTGCAVPGTSSVTTTTAMANTISAHNAKDAITIGKSTKADVIAALGKTTVISFDSGFEVWLYQVAGDTPVKPRWWELFGHAGSEKRTLGKAEFVVLFAPSGVVTKTRIRPASPANEAEEKRP